MSFSFDGTRKAYVKATTRTVRPPWAGINRELLKIYGKAGAHLKSSEIDVRVITVEMKLTNTTFSSFKKLEENLAGWLVTDEPKELIFDDETDRVYFGIISGEISLDENAESNICKGVVTFICLDPYKYSSGNPKQVISTNPTAPIVVSNLGTTKTSPKFTITLKAPTTFLDIITDKGYMRIGKPMTIDDQPLLEKETVMNDSMGSLTGWTTAQNSDIDGATVTGAFQTNGYSFYLSSAGTGSSWHGPALIKSLGQSLVDFELEAGLILNNLSYSQVGRTEVYLLDANKQAVCKVSLKDLALGASGNTAELRAGDNVTNKFIINEQGDTWKTLLNFNGVLKISRRGNKWRAYVAKIVDGAHKVVRDRYFNDINNQFTRTPQYVVVHIGVQGSNSPNEMYIGNVKVSKFNNLSAIQVPFIGEADDVFEFIHETEEILKNGELFGKYKDFGATFFKLEKGDNAIVFNPPEAIGEVKAEWRDAFL